MPEAALAAGHIVIRLELQIAIPGRRRIGQRAQIPSGNGQQLLNVAPLGREVCGLGQQGHGGFGLAGSLVHGCKVVKHVYVVGLLAPGRFQNFAGPLVISGMPVTTPKLKSTLKSEGASASACVKKLSALGYCPESASVRPKEKLAARSLRVAPSQRAARLSAA